MPSIISPALKAEFQKGSPNVATCVKITREDGQVFGFTSLDESFTFGGVLYNHNGSVDPTSIKSSAGTGVDSAEFTGPVSANSIILPEEVRRGLWNDADVEIFKVNPLSLGDGKKDQLNGFIGGITLEDLLWKVEVFGLSAYLKQEVGDVTSLTCLTTFCSNQCKLNVADFTFTRTVSDVDDAKTVDFQTDNHASGYYTKGWIEFLDGPNAGYKREVKLHTLVGGNTAHIILRDPFPYTPENGQQAKLTRGCNKLWVTCSTVFHNGRNFRGEPHIPGSETIATIGRQN
jgi:uncharacterized phage protein (TIGR02218 family)